MKQGESLPSSPFQTWMQQRKVLYDHVYIVFGRCSLGVDILFTHCKWTHWTDLLERVYMHVNIVVLHKVVVGHVG